LYVLPITTEFFLHHKSAFQGNLIPQGRRGLGEKKGSCSQGRGDLVIFLKKRIPWVSQGRRGLGDFCFLKNDFRAS
jgi:hypothetical protein